MKVVTKYEAKDGSLHDSEFACRHHEQKLQVMEKIQNDLLASYDEAEEIYEWIKNNIELFE